MRLEPQIEGRQRRGTSAVARDVGTRRARVLLAVTALAVALLQPLAAEADARTQARRMHDRIAGVPPTAAVLDDMAADIAAGRALDAAYTAMEHRAFYDVTLKNFATPWTNRDQTVFAPLNDYVATVIGMVRDDVPFNLVLSDDILYTGGGTGGVPAYSPATAPERRGRCGRHRGYRHIGRDRIPHRRAPCRSRSRRSR